jgi:hypothetical protein
MSMEADFYVLSPPDALNSLKSLNRPQLRVGCGDPAQ